MSSGLQRLNKQNKVALWAERISECRNSGLSIQEWCDSHNLCKQTYYKWQKRLFEIAGTQQAAEFAEVTPTQPVHLSPRVSVTVRIGGTEADIHSGADAETVEMVLRVLQSC